MPVTNTPRNGMQKPRASSSRCLPRAAVKPVVFTANVALPPPLRGIGSTDGLTVQVGELAETGSTEQLRFTVSVKSVQSTYGDTRDALPFDGNYAKRAWCNGNRKVRRWWWRAAGKERVVDS
jgi:hypothetical protein